MALTLDVTSKTMKIKVLKGIDFALLRDNVKKLADKKPIYKFIDGSSSFSHWEVPISEFGNLVKFVGLKKILPESDKAKALIEDYRIACLPIDQLEPYTGEIVWKRLPKFQEQEDFIRISVAKKRLIAAFSCGMGKSYVSLMRALVMGAQRVLVVGPSKNHYVTWRSEVEQTTDWTSVKYHGTPAKRKKLREAGFKDNVVFTTYTILHELVGQEFDFVIFDEAHTLAHKETKAFKNAQKMLKSLPGVPLLLLSGTPILHKPRDLWALIHLIDPQMAGDFHTWTKRYEKVVQTIVKKIPIKSGGEYQTDERGRIKLRTIEIPIKVVNQNTEELADLTKSIIFRRKLSDHVKFKDRVEVEKVEMLPRQLEMYREAREELYLELSNKQLKLSSGILGRITRFLQICEGCFNLDPTITDSAKYDLLFDELDNAQGKVIVWSRFLPGSKLLYEKYKDRAVLYNGELTEHQRNVSIWNFQGCNNAQDQKEWEKLNKTSFKEPGQAQFMFGTMGDITANLNLPACDYQIVTSFLWNGSKVEQTLSRIKRLTQESDEVYSKIILCESPRNFEENAFKLMMSNHLTTLEILDGKGDQGYIKAQELLKLI